MVKLVIKIFNRLFILVPLGLSVFLSAVYIVGGWKRISPKYTLEYFYLPELQMSALLPSFLMIAAFFAAMYYCSKAMNITEERREIAINSIIIFVIAVLVRLTLIILFKDEWVPFSDFERVWGISHGKLNGNIEYYTLFPSYLNYANFQRSIIHLLGDSYVNILYTNAVFAGITGAAISLTAYEVSSSIRTAFVSGMIYALMPSSVLYTTVGGPDIFTVCLNSLGTFCIVSSFKRGWKVSVVGSVIAGILFGLGASYKAFAIIIIIALIMAYFVRWICERSAENELSNRGIKSLAIMCICFVLVIIGYSGTKEAVISQTEKEFGVQLDMSTSTPHFLLVGLNTQGEGQISKGNISREYYQYYLNNGQDFQGAKRHAYNLLKKDWKDNKKEVPKLFIKKAIWAWQDDVIPATYLGNSVSEKGKKDHAEFYSWLTEVAPEASQAYYFVIMLCAFLGSMSYIRRKTLNYDVEFVELIIFGFFCLLMLSEAQSRYKCLIMPYVCILSTMGIMTIADKIRERKATWCEQSVYSDSGI